MADSAQLLRHFRPSLVTTMHASNACDVGCDSPSAISHAALGRRTKASCTRRKKFSNDDSCERLEFVEGVEDKHDFVSLRFALFKGGRHHRGGSGGNRSLVSGSNWTPKAFNAIDVAR
jgi:hypothetical protein